MNRIKVFSYNVLSSNLATPSAFPKSDPEHLKPLKRLAKMKTMLEEKIELDRPVILLQEVTVTWSEDLYVFFNKQKYQFIPSNHGTYYTGHMGVSVAFPNEMKFDQVANKSFSSSLIWPPVKGVGDWATVKYNPKRWLGVKFLVYERPLWIITCHFPCVFLRPEMTNTYAYSFLHSVNSIVKNDPVIIGGDFNYIPTSEANQIIITGDPNYESLKSNDCSPTNWPLKKLLPFSQVPIDSFTYFSSIKETKRDFKPFKGTIDHFYYRNVVFDDLDEIDQPDDPLPNEHYSSDHLPICATFSF